MRTEVANEKREGEHSKDLPIDRRSRTEERDAATVTKAAQLHGPSVIRDWA
jgi:hypothetical protein